VRSKELKKNRMKKEMWESLSSYQAIGRNCARAGERKAWHMELL
jgi:hypothetical protein